MSKRRSLHWWSNTFMDPFFIIHLSTRLEIILLHGILLFWIYPLCDYCLTNPLNFSSFCFVIITSRIHFRQLFGLASELSTMVSLKSQACSGLLLLTLNRLKNLYFDFSINISCTLWASKSMPVDFFAEIPRTPLGSSLSPCIRSHFLATSIIGCSPFFNVSRVFLAWVNWAAMSGWLQII